MVFSHNLVDIISTAILLTFVLLLTSGTIRLTSKVKSVPRKTGKSKLRMKKSMTVFFKTEKYTKFQIRNIYLVTRQEFV
ncbi:hypothetical protein BV378_33465 [Nostoc sp. RF31YmG]|nr:hypothetical protein BV378_33465 [Nostoc sp. RF31YmG]